MVPKSLSNFRRFRIKHAFNLLVALFWSNETTRVYRPTCHRVTKSHQSCFKWVWVVIVKFFPLSSFELAIRLMVLRGSNLYNRFSFFSFLSAFSSFTTDFHFFSFFSRFLPFFLRLSNPHFAFRSFSTSVFCILQFLNKNQIEMLDDCLLRHNDGWRRLFFGRNFLK